MPNRTDAVTEAADRLITAFAGNDRANYFAAFSPDATFVFHNLDRRLESREAYEAEWDLWVSRDGFRVITCRSSERKIQLAGRAAIFTHLVETEVEICGELIYSRERETIIFDHSDDHGWLAIHEHLSSCPQATG